MNEVKFKANKKDLEALDERVTALEEGGGGLTWHDARIQVTQAMYTNAAHTKNSSDGSLTTITKEGTAVTVADVTKCGLGVQYTPAEIVKLVSGASGGVTIWKTFSVTPYLVRTATQIKPAYIVTCLSDLDDDWTASSGTEYRSFYWFSE